jgi:hypothetical protein
MVFGLSRNLNTFTSLLRTNRPHGKEIGENTGEALVGCLDPKLIQGNLEGS